jgi:cytochrome P450
MLKSSPPAHTICAHLLKIIDPATGKPLTIDQLKAEVTVIWLAGFETTAHALTFCILCIALHPEVSNTLNRAG